MTIYNLTCSRPTGEYNGLWSFLFVLTRPWVNYPQYGPLARLVSGSLGIVCESNLHVHPLKVISCTLFSDGRHDSLFTHAANVVYTSSYKKIKILMLCTMDESDEPLKHPRHNSWSVGRFYRHFFFLSVAGVWTGEMWSSWCFICHRARDHWGTCLYETLSMTLNYERNGTERSCERKCIYERSYS